MRSHLVEDRVPLKASFDPPNGRSKRKNAAGFAAGYSLLKYLPWSDPGACDASTVFLFGASPKAVASHRTPCLTGWGTGGYAVGGMTRRTIQRAALILICLALPALATAAVTFPPKPAAGHFYSDEAGLVREAEGKEIDRIAGELLKEQKVPIIVVTIESLAAHDAAGYTIERYAAALFNDWGIGSQSRNYGMLLLVSKGDRRARIELGAAWSQSHDIEAQRVMGTLIVPEFRSGNYSEGILAGVRGMDALARGLKLPSPKAPWWVLPLFLVFIAGVIAVIVSLFKSGRKGWGWALIIALGALLFFIFRAAAQSGGSGGAFGGGSSGGGGASGSW